jgi:phasin family protein
MYRNLRFAAHNNLIVRDAPMIQTNPFAAFETFAAFTKGPAAFNAEAVSAFYQKNFETLIQANAVLTEGARVVAGRGTEILQGVAKEAPDAFRGVLAAKTPAEFVANQAELAKRSIERATAQARELADVVTKAQYEALDIVSKRVFAGLDEVAGSAKRVVADVTAATANVKPAASAKRVLAAAA